MQPSVIKAIKQFRKSFKNDLLWGDVQLSVGSDGFSLEVELLINNFSLEKLHDRFYYLNVTVDSLSKTYSKNGMYLLSAYSCECDKVEHNKFIYIEVEVSVKFVRWINFYHFYRSYEFSYDKSTKKYTARGAKGVKFNDLSSLDGGVITIPYTPFVFESVEYINKIKQISFKYTQLLKDYESLREQGKSALLSEDIESLAKYVDSPLSYIRGNVARNTHASSRILKILSKNATPEILKDIFCHPNTSLELFKEIADRIKDGFVPAPYLYEITDLPRGRVRLLLQNGISIKNPGRSNIMDLASESIENAGGWLGREEEKAVKHRDLAAELLNFIRNPREQKILHTKIANFDKLFLRKVQEREKNHGAKLKVFYDNKERMKKILKMLSIDNSPKEVRHILNDPNRAADFIDFLLLAENTVSLARGVLTYLDVNGFVGEQMTREEYASFFGSDQTHQQGENRSFFTHIGKMALTHPKVALAFLQAVRTSLNLNEEKNPEYT